MAAGQSDTEFRVCPGAGGLPAAASSVRPRQAGGPSVNGCADSVEGAAGGAQSRANSQSGPGGSEGRVTCRAASDSRVRIARAGQDHVALMGCRSGPAAEETGQCCLRDKASKRARRPRRAAPAVAQGAAGRSQTFVAN